MSTINFDRVSDPFGCFSNFAAYPVTLDGVLWPTSEHYFQAQKFHDEAQREAILTTESPMDAARMGRDRSKRLRENWESIKDEVMYRVVLAKFAQHPGIRSQLLSTDDAPLVEHTKNDSYWGDGGDGSGKNMLGQILMRVREEIRQSVRE
jgi:hypothetical protein